ncbi:MAG: C39 family peptidase [Eubacterium sp.]|nr:C39 family peptidase [Eubacterium sp.]
MLHDMNYSENNYNEQGFYLEKNPGQRAQRMPAAQAGHHRKKKNDSVVLGDRMPVAQAGHHRKKKSDSVVRGQRMSAGHTVRKERGSEMRGHKSRTSPAKRYDGLHSADKKDNNRRKSKSVCGLIVLTILNAVLFIINISIYDNKIDEKTIQKIMNKYSAGEMDFSEINRNESGMVADLAIDVMDRLERNAVDDQDTDDQLTEEKKHSTDRCRASEDNQQQDGHENDETEKEDEFADLSEEDRQKAAEIIENSVDYPEEFIQLMERNHETVDFVYEYPQKGDKPTDNNISIEIKQAEKGQIPLFLQWDERWGYQKYGDGYIADNGCGPTALSMVSVYLTKKEKYTPAYIADYAEKNDLYVDGAGTSWELLSEKCTSFGVCSEEVGLDENAMVEELEEGHPMIACVSEGDFTSGGHFIVITDYEDGCFRVNDPNSVIRTNKRWDYDTLSKQIDGLWSYHKK